jgi:hypothetical protein
MTNTCTKSFFINCNTLLYVSTLLGHLQGELSVVVTLRLHFIVERECAVDCALRCFLEACRPGPQRVHASKQQRSTQSTAHSLSNIKCNLSVTTRESSP